jgi:hypothetical protein
MNTRIAPSPTGDMHIGTARTAYFNWLMARSSNGLFTLRIDDTESKMFSFDWFFHICVMYGGPSKRLLEMRRRDPQPTPPDDDNILDDDFDDDYDFDDDGEAKAKLIREFDAEVEKYRAK